MCGLKGQQLRCSLGSRRRTSIMLPEKRFCSLNLGGARLVADKQCACGYQLAEQAKFCSRCGRPTVAPEVVSALPKGQPPDTTSAPGEGTTRAPRRMASVPLRD